MKAVVFLLGLALSCNAQEQEPRTTAAAVKSSAAPQPDRAPPSASQAAPMPRQKAHGLKDVRLDHIRRELGGAKPDEVLPWLVGLHGLGDDPESFSSLVRNARFKAHAYFPRAPRPYASGFDWLGARVSGSEAALTAGVESASDALASLLAELQKEAQNRGKPVVFGFSQGGILSFALAVHPRAQLAASLPISGWLPPSMLPRRLAEAPPPLFVFHGEADKVVPYAPTQGSVRELQKLGARVTFNTYSGVGHQIVPAMHRDFMQTLEAQL